MKHLVGKGDNVQSYKIDPGPEDGYPLSEVKLHGDSTPEEGIPWNLSPEAKKEMYSVKKGLSNYPFWEEYGSPPDKCLGTKFQCAIIEALGQKIKGDPSNRDVYLEQKGPGPYKGWYLKSKHYNPYVENTVNMVGEDLIELVYQFLTDQNINIDYDCRELLKFKMAQAEYKTCTNHLETTYFSDKGNLGHHVEPKDVEVQTGLVGQADVEVQTDFS